MDRRSAIKLGMGAAVATAGGAAGTAAAAPAVSAATSVSDAVLARSLGAFQSECTEVNGTRLHHVSGGRGRPLLLLPGWPQTWWQYHKVMPTLAERHRVIAVDLRGMGSSGKPLGGYDKKTMARDISALVRHLGYDEVDVVGHDIGAMVGFSLAVNDPGIVRRVAMLEVGHPDESYYQLSLLPQPGQRTHLWWFAFNQVQGLPEQLLTGRFGYLSNWLFDRSLHNPAAINAFDRELYARAYSTADAVRASNGWYQAYAKDIEDQKTYPAVTAPMLGVAAPTAIAFLRHQLTGKATDLRFVEMADTGHYLTDEQPAALARLLTDFFA